MSLHQRLARLEAQQPEPEPAPKPMHGPVLSFCLLTATGLAEWNAEKGFWSPVAERAEELRVLLDAGGGGLLYPADAEQVRSLWAFWARPAQLAPGTCPIRREPEWIEYFHRLAEQARQAFEAGEIAPEDVVAYREVRRVEQQQGDTA